MTRLKLGKIIIHFNGQSNRCKQSKEEEEAKKKIQLYIFRLPGIFANVKNANVKIANFPFFVSHLWHNCEFSLFCQFFMTQLRICFFLYFVSFGALPPMKGAPYHYGHGPPLIPRSCMVGGHPTKWHYHQFIHFLWQSTIQSPHTPQNNFYFIKISLDQHKIKILSQFKFPYYLCTVIIFFFSIPSDI